MWKNGLFQGHWGSQSHIRNQARLIEIEYTPMSGPEVGLCFPITTLGITITIAVITQNLDSDALT